MDVNMVVVPKNNSFLSSSPVQPRVFLTAPFWGASMRLGDSTDAS